MYIPFYLSIGIWITLRHKQSQTHSTHTHIDRSSVHCCYCSKLWYSHGPCNDAAICKWMWSKIYWNNPITKLWTNWWYIQWILWTWTTLIGYMLCVFVTPEVWDCRKYCRYSCDGYWLLVLLMIAIILFLLLFSQY